MKSAFMREPFSEEKVLDADSRGFPLIVKVLYNKQDFPLVPPSLAGERRFLQTGYARL